MLSNIILGTANFTQPYGILSKNKTLDNQEVLSILEKAHTKKIGILDTALNYGDITSVVSSDHLEQFQIIIKFSVLDDPDKLLERIKKQGNRIYGVMVHDPHNIPFVSSAFLMHLFQRFRQNYGIKKIGVSVYDMQHIDDFISRFSTPDIIQIPLNPFNQIFDNKDFKSYVKDKGIEIHARSLFLQGILLSETLPESLKELDHLWLEFRESVKQFPSSLYALLQWALHKDWINKWVIGVASVEDLQQIVNAVECFDTKILPCFDTFKNIQNLMTDPRNWNIQ